MQKINNFITDCFWDCLGIVGTKEYRKPSWVTHMEEMQEAIRGKKRVFDPKTSLLCTSNFSSDSLDTESLHNYEESSSQRDSSTIVSEVSSTKTLTNITDDHQQDILDFCAVRQVNVGRIKQLHFAGSTSFENVFERTNGQKFFAAASSGHYSYCEPDIKQISSPIPIPAKRKSLKAPNSKSSDLSVEQTDPRDIEYFMQKANLPCPARPKRIKLDKKNSDLLLECLTKPVIYKRSNFQNTNTIENFGNFQEFYISNDQEFEIANDESLDIRTIAHFNVSLPTRLFLTSSKNVPSSQSSQEDFQSFDELDLLDNYGGKTPENFLKSSKCSHVDCTFDVHTKYHTYPKSRIPLPRRLLNQKKAFKNLIDSEMYPLEPREIELDCYQQLHNADSQEELQEFLLLESECRGNMGIGEKESKLQILPKHDGDDDRETMSGMRSCVN